MKSFSFDLKLLSLIFIVLLFFASNSILARMAIATQNIDPFTFTFLRTISAMFVLLAIFFYKNRNLRIALKTNYLSGFMFFLYAICFSYSYINMLAGIGTLILFTVVQLTMIILALLSQEKITLNISLGIIIAFVGLVYLLYPKDDFTLSYFHTFLMFLSGIAWAIFSVLGKKSQNATLDTADSFFKATIFTLIFGIFYIFIFESSFKINFTTFIMATISGSITTAFGVFLWYKILPKIEIITASLVQLVVPILAIFLSVIFLKESITLELIISTFIILFGIFLALYKKRV